MQWCLDGVGVFCLVQLSVKCTYSSRKPVKIKVITERIQDYSVSYGDPSFMIEYMAFLPCDRIKDN